MRALVFTLMCIGACMAAHSATVYKWVDADGVTHFSDQPHPGAQKITVQAAQTYSTPAPPRAPAQRPGAVLPPRGVYTACTISRPTNDEVFMNTSTVPASVHLEPGVRPGDRIAVSLDGAAIPANVPSDSEFTLTSVVRGTHALSATVIEEATGNVICQTPSVTFHVHQPTLLSPARQ
jgi:hypothetical protein